MFTSFPDPARTTDNADKIGNAVCRNRIFLFFLQINGLPENRLRERQVKVNQVMSPFVALRYLILS